MKRRDFLKASGAAAGLALLEGCRRRDERLFEQPVARGGGLAGESEWRFGTCHQCPAGCGTKVRLVDGAAKKIEGNPAHPVNRGGLCALGQSALQQLYHPDRILQPMRRRAGANSGGPDDYEAISWQQALESVAAEIASAREGGRLGVVTGGDAIRRALWRRFAAALDGRAWAWRPADEEVERVAAARVFGWSRLPYYDLAESDFVLGLGAAFLDRWRSPVHYARALVEQRRRRRSRFVHAEARMSLTAAAADLWLPVRPGSEGVLARALGGALVDRIAGTVEGSARYRRLFSGSAPSLAEAASVCDLPVARLRWLRDQVLRAERPVVVAGGAMGLRANGVETVAAAMALNLLVGAVGRTGGVRESASLGLGESLQPPSGDETASSRSSGAAAFAQTSRPSSADLRNVDLLLISECDPGHELGLETLAALPGTVVALASVFDDTALASDLVLPIQTELERIDLSTPEPAPRPALGASGGIVDGRGESRHPLDVALALAATQEDLAVELPWRGVDDVIAAVIEARSSVLPGAAGQTAGRYRRQIQQDGGAWTDGAAADGSAVPAEAFAVDAAASVLGTEIPEPTAPDLGSDPSVFSLVPFESVKTGGADRPWIQELPDPMSTVMWGSWIEIAPVDAARLGIETGDKVRVRAADADDSDRSAEAWVFVSPATRPGTVALPLGQGHRDRGRFARGRGVNPYRLLAGEKVTGAEVGALADVRIELEPTADGRAPIYGRGLRQAEAIPAGWAPQDPTERARRDRLVELTGKKERA